MGEITARPVADSVLSRRNPAVKLLLVMVVSLTLTFVWDPWTPAAVWLLGVAAAVSLGRMRPRMLAWAHVPFLGFGLGMLVVNILTRDGTVLASAGGLRVTDTGIAVGSALLLRTLAIGVVSISFIATTDPVALMISLHQNLKLPASLTYAVLAGHQLLQDLPGEWVTIRTAQRLRQPYPTRSRLSLRAAGRAAVTVLIVSLRRAERISQALESRGLGLPGRTVWRPVRFTPSDAALIGAVLAVLAGTLVVSNWLGVLSGSRVLFQ